jgi:hypothetical protein
VKKLPVIGLLIGAIAAVFALTRRKKPAEPEPDHDHDHEHGTA